MSNLEFVRMQYIAAAVTAEFASIAMRRAGGNQPLWLLCMHRCYDARDQAKEALEHAKRLGCPVALSLSEH